MQGGNPPFIADEGTEVDLAAVWPFKYFADPRLSVAAQTPDGSVCAADMSFHTGGLTHVPVKNP